MDTIYERCAEPVSIGNRICDELSFGIQKCNIDTPPVNANGLHRREVLIQSAESDQYLSEDVIDVPTQTVRAENWGVGKAVNHAEVTATIRKSAGGHTTPRCSEVDGTEYSLHRP